ncbi:MAG: TatD family hydrolase [Ignavibacteriae bacterium]|nr:TatD family hydrolase [Ignavibacteriota bacterium]
MEFIDTHCHLFWDDFVEDLDAVLTRARAAGVGRFIVPATTLDTMRSAADIADRHQGVYATAGVHPHDTAALPDGALEMIEEHAMRRRCVAIGEIGLDYYYDYSPKERQWEALHAQLALARRLDLPVILHNRESDDDLLAICAEHQDGALRGQFHCFSSSPAYAERVLALGFHISFTGNVTYKKSTLSDVLARVPDDRILLETDAPFMAPVPHRGTRNEPERIPLIAAKFAELRGCSLAHVAEVTTRNAVELFRLPDLTQRVGHDATSG